jgi:hypothetical protein
MGEFRNPASLLGAWLHYPSGLGVNDGCEALQAGVADVEPEDLQGVLNVLLVSRRSDVTVLLITIDPER